MAKHSLKTWPEVFADMVKGIKNFDYRRNDRDFQVGDQVCFQEWNPISKKYTGNEFMREVTYIIHGGQFGIPEGFCIMGLEKAT